MRGRVALVTGGSRGIGRAIVERFRVLGADVVAPTRQELDLTDMGAVERFAASVGPVDILVNDAGVNPVSSFAHVDDTDIETALAVNLLAPIRLCRALVPGMADRGYGRVLNISSIWSVVSKPGRTTYAITKAGMNALTRSLAVEYAASNVMVNAIAPGFVGTEMTYRNNSASDIQAIEAHLPVGRLARPEEIATLAAFLASEENSFTTGQIIVADGGYTSL